ncbi:glycosyltransferase [Chitinophaga pendula]|uniref:glycosyltransferase n=1 Tax=Chitinophaga TaxID=79328 RepID=UPI000BB06C0C|nr:MULTISPECIES: glycosyltransferase [Chitinophaga]ASZ14448.1 hypothetical protein CK934_27640 [Chitinophaga sp. MD30]UCJ07896.1 glycosyltransferase [Chitinophaga pendula]
MSRILFGSVPFWAHINPTIAIAQQLKAFGHDVAYTCHPEMKDAFDKASIPYLDNFSWGDALVYVNKNMYANPKTWVKDCKREMKLDKMYKMFVHRLDEATEQYRKVLLEWKPDVCVFDMLFFPGVIAAESLNIPYVTSCPAAMPVLSKDTLPPGHGFPSYQKRPNLRMYLILKLINHYVKKVVACINHTRATYGLSPQTTYMDTPSPYLYLCYTTESFEHKRSDLLPQLYYIGPSISKELVGANNDFPWEWLEGDTPVVYFTMGTVFLSKKVIKQAIEASKGAPWKMVITITHHLSIDDFADVPENVLVKNFVPQVALLEKVDLVVSVGGMGTVGQTLHAGIPMLVIPRASDQFDVAQMAVETKSGLRLNPGQVSTNSLRKAIRELLSNPVYKQNALRLADDFRKCDAPLTAARMIEKLADNRKPLLRPNTVSPTVYSEDLGKLLDIVA